MIGCKGYDLRESDATTGAHQGGQYAGIKSGQEQIAGKPATNTWKINF